MGKLSIPAKELAEEIRAAKKVGAQASKTEPRAVLARYDRKSGRIIVDLRSGVSFLFPATLAQGLSDASPKDLTQVKVLADGFALYWESLDVALSIPDLLIGVFGSKSWMSHIYKEIGRKGGSQTSPVKARASRHNGLLGGRPKKATAA
ncbi:MAG: DUF2442 domain-containing protein [Candidatus Riflebacteria bacterium]|nr:DUF2442 domain-containing protein [Candidatus Riflebacteria bacterium]